MVRSELVRKGNAIVEKARIAAKDLKHEDVDSLLKELTGIQDEIAAIDKVARDEALAKSESPESKKEREDRELWKQFGALMRGEQVSDVARSALQPRSSVWESNRHYDPKLCFRAPGDAIAYLQGAPWSAAGRTAGILSAARQDTVVTSDIVDLIRVSGVQPLQMLPLPPTLFFEQASKIMSVNGVAHPLMAQSQDDPWAGVVITKANAEGSDKDITEAPIVGTRSITTLEYEAYCVVTDIALRRCPGYDAVIANVFRNAIASALSQDALGAGNGTTAIYGVLSELSLRTVDRATANQISWADIVGLKYAPLWYWTTGNRFKLSQTAVAYLEATLASTTGVPLFTASTANGIWDRLAGRPFDIDFCPALGTKGDIMFINPAWYSFAVDQDIVFRSTNQGLTLGKANSTAFFVFCHIGGRLLWPQACSVLAVGGGTPSPTPTPTALS